MENRSDMPVCKCNGCGKILRTEWNQDRVRELDEYVHVEKTWGYFSNQDGKRVRWNLCEACCERLYDTFVIPPEVEMVTELL